MLLLTSDSVLVSCMSCRQFLYGLQRFGRGDWKSISRYSVRTKSNSQVASHAQKYFKRLSSAKEGKRLSINNITTVNPEKLLAFEMATTSCMPRDCKEAPTGAGTEQLLPPNPERSNEASSASEAKQVGRKRSKKEASSANKKPVDRDPVGEASCTDGKKLQPRHPKRSRTCNENLLLPRYPNEGSSTFQNLPPGLPEKATIETGNQLLPPSPFGGSPFSDPNFSAPMFPVCEISSPPFAIEPAQEVGAPAPSVELPGAAPPQEGTTGFYSSDTVMQDAEAGLDGRFDIGSSTEFMDLDMSLFPHFLD